MKRSITRAAAVFLCVFLLAQSVSATDVLVPGGQIIGIALEDGSVTVAAFHETLGENARAAGLQPGDRITHIDDKPITKPADVHRALERADGTVTLALERKGKTLSVTLSPHITASGPRLGVYLKEGVTGVGTLTWFDPETGSFGALGHGVNGNNGQPVGMEDGRVYAARVTSVEMGRAGDPGQLAGAVETETPFGSVEKNTAQGIFGACSAIADTQAMAVGEPEDVRVGPAVIRSTVEGSQVQEYSVEILKIYPNQRQSCRNMLLKVTDPALLEATGGIVQGMSGSPIIQDGKLVGAVTHVLVNDPQTGYGIFIENMLEAAG